MLDLSAYEVGDIYYIMQKKLWPMGGGKNEDLGGNYIKNAEKALKMHLAYGL